MSQKNKGSNAEREIVHLFWQTKDWAASRIAGSGSIKYPAPDIIAGNKNRRLAIECKTSKKQYQYLEKKEIHELEEYSKKINAEPWVAIKFSKKEWGFIQTNALKPTRKHYMIKKKDLEIKGISFQQLANIRNL